MSRDGHTEKTLLVEGLLMGGEHTCSSQKSPRRTLQAERTKGLSEEDSTVETVPYYEYELVFTTVSQSRSTFMHVCHGNA